MNRQRWQTVRRILADCLRLPTLERPAHVAARCESDAELRKEVDSLLRASSQANGYFESLSDRADAMALTDESASLVGRDVGHFSVTAALGAGGMGEVFRARDNRLHRDVALKVLGGDREQEPDLMARFDREATVLAALNHPNIASIYGREEIDGRPLLVLELVDGHTLGERLADGPLSVEAAMRIGCDIARGLEAAHEQEIIHRDLKPSNVMLTSGGSVKILDFGIAKPLQLDNRPQTPDLTATGTLLGTVPYMSPEQIRGLAIDQRADVWAFGCLLYEMLSGRKAFERETVADTLAAIIEHDPRCDLLPDDTPAALKDLLCNCIDKDVDNRLSDVREARRRIEVLLATPAADIELLAYGPEEALERAREAVDEHDWQQAYELLEPLQEGLGADDLTRFSESAWWTGKLDKSIEADQRVFSLYVGEGDRGAAAAAAIRMADHNARRLQSALVRGWLRRAERLLENEPECAAHGWLLRAHIMQATSDGRYNDALSLTDSMMQVGERLGDLDLQAVAIQYQGATHLKMGCTADGMGLIDEAVVAAISGDLSPMATAIIYCNAITACRSLADYERAGEWTAVAKRWCERQAIAGFPGICRVVRAEVMRLHGLWSEAAKEASRACTELESFSPNVVRVAFHELGEVRLRMGDYDAAHDAFTNARRLGRDPQPGMALLMLAEGNADGAASSIKRAVATEDSDYLARARLLPAQVEIALARGDFDTARVACAELMEIAESFDAPVLQAAAEHACGALLLAEDEPAEAIDHLRAAIRVWDSANVPYECARARELQAQAFLEEGDEDTARLELQAACATFVELGAAPDSRRAAEFLAEHCV